MLGFYLVWCYHWNGWYSWNWLYCGWGKSLWDYCFQSFYQTHSWREDIATSFFFFFELQTPMVSYVNVHAILEGRRDRAKKSPSDDSVLSQVILSCFVIRRLDASCMCWCWLFFRVWLLFCTVGISFWSFIFYGLLLLLLLRVSKFERLL